MKNWPKDIKTLIKQDGDAVLATIGPSKGSTPRGSGTKMVIGRDTTLGTIGGGNLEFMVTEQARKMLVAPEVNLLYQHYALGPLLSQCCGGATNVLLEKLTPDHLTLLDQVSRAIANKQPYGLVSATHGPKVNKQFVTVKPSLDRENFLTEWNQNDAVPVYMFGAGHVGKAMAAVLGRLNFDVIWCDDRKDQFPELVAENVLKILTDNPVQLVSQAPAGAIFLIFTYSHQQDYAITRAILKRTDARYCGMIGSKTKRARFEKYFIKSGGSEQELSHFTCPIGLSTVMGKAPDSIAISVAAELLSLPPIS